MKSCSLSEGKTPGAVSVDEGSQHCVTRRQKAIKRTNGVDSDTELRSNFRGEHALEVVSGSLASVV